MIGRGSLLAVMALAGASAFGQTFSFAIFENQAGVDVSGVAIDLTLVESGGHVDLILTNNSVGGVATRFLIEDHDLLASFDISPIGIGADWSPGSTSSNPPGSLQHFSGPWAGTFGNAQADPSPIANGLHSGESLTLSLGLSGGSISDLADAIRSEQLRIVTHIQALGENGGQSVWGVTVPSPSTVGIVGLAVIGLVSRRRR